MISGKLVILHNRLTGGGKVIRMDQYEYIRTAHRVYDKGIRQIQKETGHSRVTIRKVLQREPAGYKRRERSYPVLGDHRDTIERWLSEDRKRGTLLTIDS